MYSIDNTRRLDAEGSGIGRFHFLGASMEIATSG